MKSMLMFVVLLFMFQTAFSQIAGSIKGRVLDTKTKEPVPNAHVYVEQGGDKIGTVTDMDGRFTLKPLNAGTYQLKVSCVGYNDKVVPVSVFSGEISYMKDIYLSDVIVLGGKEGVVIHADREKDDARLIDPGQINKLPIKSADIEKMAGSNNISMIIRSVSSEVQISNDGREIIFRGSRNGSSACYVDGVKQENLSSTVPRSAIGSVMVYTGGIPARYGDVTGGIIVIETKSYFDVVAEKRIKEYKKKEQAEEE